MEALDVAGELFSREPAADRGVRESGDLSCEPDGAEKFSLLLIDFSLELLIAEATRLDLLLSKRGVFILIAVLAGECWTGMTVGLTVKFELTAAFSSRRGHQCGELCVRYEQSTVDCD